MVLWNDWCFSKEGVTGYKDDKRLLLVFLHLLQLFMSEDLQFSSGVIPGLEKYVFRKYPLRKHLYCFEDYGNQPLTCSELWDDQAALWWGCLSSNSPVEGGHQERPSVLVNPLFKVPCSCVKWRNNHRLIWVFASQSFLPHSCLKSSVEVTLGLLPALLVDYKWLATFFPHIK